MQMELVEELQVETTQLDQPLAKQLDQQTKLKLTTGLIIFPALLEKGSTLPTMETSTISIHSPWKFRTDLEEVIMYATEMDQSELLKEESLE